LPLLSPHRHLKSFAPPENRLSTEAVHVPRSEEIRFSAMGPATANYPANCHVLSFCAISGNPRRASISLIVYNLSKPLTTKTRANFVIPNAISSVIHNKRIAIGFKPWKNLAA
jgi:hypothetical protein